MGSVSISPPPSRGESHEVSKLSGFFDCIQQDPVISRVKLIAEPWDVGEGGYQVGNFPVLWAEWNGKYRDSLRAYWKGDEGQLGELAYRLAGSADLFEEGGRKPYASVNFLTAHDGFTLNDAVSYNEKHNQANGENSQDGHNDNRSWNCGAEGPTEDEAINTLRRRQLRNLLTTLILSQGVPMLLGGDEFARTQKGNNNAYCQDNEISWFAWDVADWQETLREFTARLIHERRRHPVFRRPKYFQGRRVATGLKDIMWFSGNGTEMTQEEWSSGHLRCLGMMLSGDTMDIRDAEGQPVRDDTFLMLFNAHHEPVKFELAGAEGVDWEVFLDTRHETGAPGALGQPDFRRRVRIDRALDGHPPAGEGHPRSGAQRRLEAPSAGRTHRTAPSRALLPVHRSRVDDFECPRSRKDQTGADAFRAGAKRPAARGGRH